MVGFLRFLINTEMGSRSMIFQSFGCWKIFFGELLAKKNSIFRFFRGQKDFLNPVFTERFKMRLFLHYSMQHLSVDRPAVKFFTIFFPSVFVKNRAEIFENFSNRFDIPHCPGRSFSTNTFAGSFCFLLSCIGEIVIDRGRNF